MESDDRELGNRWKDLSFWQQRSLMIWTYTLKFVLILITLVLIKRRFHYMSDHQKAHKRFKVFLHWLFICDSLLYMGWSFKINTALRRSWNKQNIQKNEQTWIDLLLTCPNVQVFEENDERFPFKTIRLIVVSKWVQRLEFIFPV